MLPTKAGGSAQNSAGNLYIPRRTQGPPRACWSFLARIQPDPRHRRKRMRHVGTCYSTTALASTTRLPAADTPAPDCQARRDAMGAISSYGSAEQVALPQRQILPFPRSPDLMKPAGCIQFALERRKFDLLAQLPDQLDRTTWWMAGSVRQIPAASRAARVPQ